MIRLSEILYKYFKFNPLKNICIKMSRFAYRFMKTCEYLSGENKIIEAKQKEIKAKVEGAKNVKQESEFLEHIVITKEEHIERLYMFIRALSVNFRNENYKEVDAMLKKLHL